MKNDIINQIKNLKSIQPSGEWLDFCRADIAKEADIAIANSRFSLSNFRQFTAMHYRPMVAYMTMFLLLIGGPIGIVRASKGSLPGDTLYPVKIIAEQVHIKLASGTAKTNLQMQAVDNRSDELAQLIEIVPGYTQAQQRARIEQAMVNLHQELIQAKSQLSSMDDKIEHSNVVKVANQLSEKSSSAMKVLSETKNKLSENMPVNLSEKITEVSNTAYRANTAALMALVSNNELATSTDIKSDVAGQLEKRILTAENDYKILTEKITDLKNTAPKSTVTATTAVAEESKKLIEGAKESYSKGDYKNTLDNLIASQELQAGVESIVSVTATTTKSADQK